MLRIIGDGEHARMVRAIIDVGRQAPGRHFAIGGVLARERAVMNDKGSEPWATLIHPTAQVSGAFHKEGVFVGVRAVINPGAKIGAHTIINTGAIVEHDVEIGDFTNVNPGAVIGGGAKIGSRTVLGLGCRIRDHVTVGSGVTVGMGAVVVKDVPDGATVMGCPAK